MTIHSLAIRFLAISGFLVSTDPCMAQHKFRIYYGISVTHTYAQFENGRRLNGGNGVTFPGALGYSIEPRMSLDWNDAPGAGFASNVGRNVNYSIQVERIFTRTISLSTGLEFGGRNFALMRRWINGDEELLLRSYRNFCMPFIFTHSRNFNNRWSFRKNIGFSLNTPESVNQRSDAHDYEIKVSRPVYPLAILGIEFARTSERGRRICFEVSYNHGFFNMIDDAFRYDVDYGSGYRRDEQKIVSNGSHFRFGIRFSPGEWIPGAGEKRTKKQPPSFSNHIPVITDFDDRIIPKAVDIELDTTHVKVCVWDDQRVDGDSVSVEYKDSLVLNNIPLDKTIKCITLELERNRPNYVYIHALNEGRAKPNTAQVLIYDKAGEKKLNLRSTMKKSGAINLYVP